MKIDPTLIKGFRASLFYGLAALLFFHFFGPEASWTDKLIKAAATAGIFLLLFYVTSRTLRKRNEGDKS